MNLLNLEIIGEIKWAMAIAHIMRHIFTQTMYCLQIHNLYYVYLILLQFYSAYFYPIFIYFILFYFPFLSLFLWHLYQTALVALSKDVCAFKELPKDGLMFPTASKNSQITPHKSTMFTQTFNSFFLRQINTIIWITNSFLITDSLKYQMSTGPSRGIKLQVPLPKVSKFNLLLIIISVTSSDLYLFKIIIFFILDLIFFQLIISILLTNHSQYSFISPQEEWDPFHRHCSYHLQSH